MSKTNWADFTPIDDAGAPAPAPATDWSKFEPIKEASAARKLGDLGLSVAKGVVAVPEAAVGLADLVSGGRAGKFLENEGGAVGFRPKQAKEFLTSLQSDDLQSKQQQFQQADGVVDKFGVAVTNPSLIANTVAESVPLMGAGAVPARALLAAAPRVGAVGAGAIGEGLVGAGSAAEQIRQETEDGLLTGKQAALAGASGVATAAFGAAGGKVAQRLGIADVDTALAQGTLNAGAAANKGLLRRTAEGVLSEGVLEELPQSLSEQALQNIALDKPVTEGLADAGVMGVLAGGVMGGGAAALTRQQQAQGLPDPDAVQPPAQPPAPAAEQPPAPFVNPASLTGNDAAAMLGSQGAGLTGAADPLRAVVTPSQAMGINPNAGAISRVAAEAVDGPASMEMAVRQAERDMAALAAEDNPEAGADPLTAAPDPLIAQVAGYVGEMGTASPQMVAAKFGVTTQRAAELLAEADPTVDDLFPPPQGAANVSNTDAAGALAAGVGGPVGVDAAGSGPDAGLLAPAAGQRTAGTAGTPAPSVQESVATPVPGRESDAALTRSKVKGLKDVIARRKEAKQTDALPRVDVRAGKDSKANARAQQSRDQADAMGVTGDMYALMKQGMDEKEVEKALGDRLSSIDRWTRGIFIQNVQATLGIPFKKTTANVQDQPQGTAPAAAPAPTQAVQAPQAVGSDGAAQPGAAPAGNAGVEAAGVASDGLKKFASSVASSGTGSLADGKKAVQAYVSQNADALADEVVAKATEWELKKAKEWYADPDKEAGAMGLFAPYMPGNTVTNQEFAAALKRKVVGAADVEGAGVSAPALAKREDGTLKNKSEYTADEWSAYTKSVIDAKLGQQAAAPSPTTTEPINGTQAAQAVETTPQGREETALLSDSVKPAGKYQLPQGRVTDSWFDAKKRGTDHPDYEPTPRQQVLMDEVAKAKDAGAFYANDVKNAVAKALGIDAETRAANTTGVEGGDFGMDVYLAGRALDAKRKNAREKEIAKELSLKPGDKLGTLVFNDMKVTNSVEVESVSDDGLSFNFKGKRGPVGVKFSTGPVNVKGAIERAHEKGKRKDTYEQFIEARKAPAAPAVAAPAPIEPQETTHNGTRIYRTRAKLGDEVKTMWAVETPENKARRAAGERTLGGDTLHDTIEQAKAAADREAKQYADRKAFAEQQDAEERARKDADEARKASNRGKSILERRKDAILDGDTKLPASAGLGNTTRRNAMQMAVEQGRAVVERQVDDTAAKKRDQEAIDRVRRAGYMLGLSNENIPVVKAGLEAQARLKANDYKKPEYRVYAGSEPTGGFFEITKIEYEYAQELMAQKAATPAAVPVAQPTAQQASEFIPAPGGGLDYGEITPEMSKAMRRQAGKIRLQRGDEKFGLVHIEQRHGAEIRSAGFPSVEAFVADIAGSIAQVWQPGATSQLVALKMTGNDRIMYVQLQAGSDGGGDFYTVNTAFPARSGYVRNKKDWKKLWEGRAQPSQPATSEQAPFAESPQEAGEATTIPSGQSETSVAQPTPEAQADADGIRVIPGKGLIKGKFLVEVDGQGVPSFGQFKSPFATEEVARAAAEAWKQTVADRATESAAERARRDSIAEKFRAGEAVTNAEIESLGLRAGASDMRWFMSTAANLFGLNSRDIRPIVKDLIRTSLTDMGAKREFVPTRQALELIAKSQTQPDQAAAAPAPQANTPKLTQSEAKELMEWQDLGQKDGIKTHILTFYESKADKDAKRGRMVVATITKETDSKNWVVEGTDDRLAMLAMAKKKAEEAGMARAVADGFVEAAAAVPEAPKKGLAGVRAKKAAEAEAQRAAYFTPGNVVKSYGGHDRVLEYTPVDERGTWSVRVQRVVKQGDGFVDAPREIPRWHSTQPEAKELAAGPVFKAPAAVQESPAPAAQPAIVENFGEKLPPARRAMAAKLSETLSDDNITKLPLSQIWPASENEAIEDTFAAAVAHVMREAIPAKPRTAYKVNSWVNKVKMLRDFAAKILRGTVTKDFFMEEMSKFSALRDLRSKIKLLEQIDREQWKRIGDVSEAPGAVRFEEGKPIPSPSVSVSVDGKSHWLRGSGDVLTHLDAIKAMLGTDAPENKMQFEIRQESRGERKVFINKKGDKEYRRLMEFATVDEARKAIREQYADLVAAWEGVKARDNITERDLRSDTNRERAGKDHRKSRDVTAEEFESKFGFRGGEFGKWVGQGKGAQERQFMLNSAYDALMDLSDLLGIPPKAISLEGSLGIAFGSRGSGWASAHFEPSNLVINLTKTRGAGALAHEWFHALDNYFARKRGGEVPFDGDNNAYRRNNYVTYKTTPLMVRKDGRGTPVSKERLAEWRKTSQNAGYLAEDQWMEDPNHKQGVRAEVEQAFSDLVKTLNDSPMLKRAQTLDGVGRNSESDGYWSRVIERAARAFENYVQTRMMEQGYHNDFLANVKVADEVGKNTDRYPYLLPSEIAPVADAFQALFDTIQTKEDEAGNVVMFSQGLLAPASLGPKPTADQIQRLVDKVQQVAKNALPVTVTASPSDIPGLKVPAGAKPSGALIGGRIYLFADNLKSTGDAYVTLFHELFHLGLQKVIPAEDYAAMLAKFSKNLLVQRFVREWKASPEGVEKASTMPAAAYDALAAEEALAMVSEELAANNGIGTNGSPGLVKAMLSWLSSVADQLGFPPAFSDWMRGLTRTDAEKFVSDMVRAAMGGEKNLGRTRARYGTELAQMTEQTRLSAGDAGSPDIRFRASPRELAGMATDQLKMTLTAPGKLSWWHKTVGTMYGLAERHPAFKPVFNAAQSFIDDVSYYATDAADLAPKMLPKLESWKDIAKSPISAEDNKAIEAPINEGTLLWARDESGRPVKVAELEAQAADMTADQKARRLLRNDKINEGVLRMWQGLPQEQYEKLIESRYQSQMLTPGVVWTDAELKAIWKLNDAQIGLYREVRAAIDKSLDNLAKSDLVRFVGKDGVGIKDAIMEAGSVDEAALMARDYFIGLSEAEPDRAEMLLATANGIMDRADKVTRLKEQGYAPLSRFGKYTVDVVTEEGRQYFGLFESMREANQMAARMRGEFGKDAVSQGTLSDESFKLFQGITPETLELFGNMLGLSDTGDTPQDQAFQAYLKLTKNNRSAMKRLIQRKGILGYSQDVGRVLANFVYSNARQTASALHIGDLTDAINAIPQGQGEVKDMAVKLGEYIKNPQEEAQAFRGLLFAQYLGGNISSAIINALQPFQVSFPYLSQFGGVKQAGAEMLRATREYATGKKNYEPDLAKALKNAEDDGTVSPQEVFQLMAQAKGAGTLRSGDGTVRGELLAKGGNAWAKTAMAWGKVFGVAEQFNRRTTFIAAYRIAKAQKMADPAAFAKKAVQETQFIYSKANKPQWARGAIGATVFTFKVYSISYIELLHRMATQGGPEGKRAALLAVAVLLLMGGAGGLPFMEDGEDIADTIAQVMGYNFSSKQAKQELLEELFGEAAAQFIERGISGVAGVPIDVSGRFGMGNLVPGTGAFLQRNSNARDVLEVLGPAGDLARRGQESVAAFLKGDLKQSAYALSPRAIYNMAKGGDMLNTGMYRDDKGFKVIEATTGEGVLKAIGFQPNTVAKVQESNYLMQRQKDYYNSTAQSIRAKWARGLFEKDEAMVAEAREAINAWNEKNPDQRMSPNMPAIWKRVREMAKDKDQRIADTAPKAMRQQFREETARVREAL